MELARPTILLRAFQTTLSHLRRRIQATHVNLPNQQALQAFGKALEPPKPLG